MLVALVCCLLEYEVLIKRSLVFLFSLAKHIDECYMYFYSN